MAENTFKLAEYRKHVDALSKIHDDAMDSPDDTPEVSFSNIRARLQHLWEMVAPENARASDTEGDEPKVGGANDSALRARGHAAVAEVFGGGAVAGAAIGRMVRDTHIKSRG